MRRIWWIILFVVASSNHAAWGQSNVDKELAPTGKFRLGMNANNATLVKRNADGTVSGLSADLGRFIAAKLGVDFEPVVYDSAAPFTASFGKTEWDIILTGRNAVVAKLVDFSSDLFFIDYVFLAAPGREFADRAQVDAPGVRIAVPRNASADVFLSRNAKAAELVRVDGDMNVGLQMLREGKADVYASSINTVLRMAERLPGAKVVGTFHTVPFAAAMQKGRSAEAQRRLAQLLDEAKAAGIIKQALEQADAKGVQLAP